MGGKETGRSYSQEGKSKGAAGAWSGWGMGKQGMKEDFRMREGEAEPRPRVIPIHPASQHATLTAKNLMYSPNTF